MVVLCHIQTIYPHATFLDRYSQHIEEFSGIVSESGIGVGIFLPFFLKTDEWCQFQWASGKIPLFYQWRGFQLFYNHSRFLFILFPHFLKVHRIVITQEGTLHDVLRTEAQVGMKHAMQLLDSESRENDEARGNDVLHHQEKAARNDGLSADGYTSEGSDRGGEGITQERIDSDQNREDE